MRRIIYPYKVGSASARLLAQALNALRVRAVGRYTPRGEDFILNWGASTIPSWNEALRSILTVTEASGLTTTTCILNKPENVANAVNKLSAFRILQNAGVQVPDFTTQIVDTINWPTTYCRQRLTGHSGVGILVSHSEFDSVLAPLYVKGIHNNGEYRVHVFNGQVIDYTKKRRHNGQPAHDGQLEVRNLATGWIYTRENLRRLERIENLAVRAVAALGLDFGAVDIIKDENGDVFVLEVNCAPGLAPTTLSRYVEAINQLAQ